MSNPFKRNLRQFLSFSRSDRNAILILSTIILILVVSIIVLKNIEPIPKSDFSDIEKRFSEWENKHQLEESTPILSLFNFDPNTITLNELDSLAIPDFVKNNVINYRNAGGRFKSSNDLRKIYGMNDSIFTLIKDYIQITRKVRPATKPISNEKTIPDGTFDPNSTTVLELQNFGFSKYQANNLVRYSNNGGIFEKPVDILRIYGVDSTFYLKIKKYIEIEKTENEVAAYPKEVISIDLNGSDSAKLVRLDGVGPYYAKRIIKYRNLLGGYYSKEQLKEVYGFPVETFNKIESQIYIDTLAVSKIRINFAGYEELIRHPYLNKNQVKAILDERDKNGMIRNISQLQSLNAFDSVTIKKVAPYVSCR